MQKKSMLVDYSKSAQMSAGKLHLCIHTCSIHMLLNTAGVLIDMTCKKCHSACGVRLCNMTGPVR